MKNEQMDEILRFREEKDARQKALLEEYGRPVVSLSLNLPGPQKRGFLEDLAFWKAAEKTYTVFGPALHTEILSVEGGEAAFFVYPKPARDLKHLAIDLEDAPFGRLFDVDVYDEKGEALHRITPRKCFLCGRPAAECIREQRHPIERLREKTKTMLLEFVADTLSGEAVASLLAEASFTPKPGLVDENNNGAHSDMNMDTLERSAHSLHPFFMKAVTIGYSGTMAELIENGKAAEKAMFKATGGVNTHKGSAFLISLLLAGIGRHLADGSDPIETAQNWAREKIPAEDTHGALVRQKYGVAGVLSEAAFGFPIGKATYEAMSQEGELAALLTAMSLCDDTNLLYRGGMEALNFVRAEAQKILALPPEKQEAATRRLDRSLIRRKLSPGGSADLFALAVFFTFEEPLFFKKARAFRDFYTYLAI